VDNRSLARVLHEIADILEIKGENPFRIRSYRLAAESVESSDRDLAALLARGEALTDLPGVGEGIEELEAAIDDGRFFSLPGMKEKKAAALKRVLAERRRRSEV
jgi:DNA polymerase (family 10)